MCVFWYTKLIIISLLRSWTQNFNVSWLLYALPWVILWRLNFMCWRFGTLCLFHLHRHLGVKTCLWKWNGQSVPKSRRIKFWRRRITQKKACNGITCLKKLNITFQIKVLEVGSLKLYGTELKPHLYCTWLHQLFLENTKHFKLGNAQFCYNLLSATVRSSVKESESCQNRVNLYWCSVAVPTVARYAVALNTYRTVTVSAYTNSR
jgi:hypothetical protein